MSKEYILYSSEGCHLCELALALCQQQLSTPRFSIKDIVDEEVLVERYGVHIPVLHRLSDQQELFWPFDQAQLSAFIKNEV